MDSQRESEKSLSPRKNYRSRKSTVTEENQSLRIQLEACKRRIQDLEYEVERLLADDTRSRQKLFDQKVRHEADLKDLHNRMKLCKGMQLPETLDAAVNETMASMTSLHHEVLDELGSLQKNAHMQLKAQEKDLKLLFSVKVNKLERELETARAQAEPEIAPAQREMNALEAEIRRSQAFNDKLQAANKALKAELKETQAVNEAYVLQHTRLIKENARLRKELQTLQPPSPHRNLEELPSISIRPRTKIPAVPSLNSTQIKLAAAVKEVQILKQQLITERGRKTDLTDTLDRCISEVRSQAVSMAAYHGRYRSDMSGKERQQVINHLMEDAKVLELVRNEAFEKRKEPSRCSSVARLGCASI